MFNYNYECFLRKPTKDEQLLAKIDTSDYQISGLTIQSSILHKFGFCSKVYRSKTTTTQKSTKKKTARYRAVITKLFEFYNSDSPAEALLEDMGESITAYAEKYGVDMQNIFFDIPSWEAAAERDTLLPRVAVEVKGKYAKPPKYKFDFDNDRVLEQWEEYEPSDAEVEECKSLYLKMLDFVKERAKGDLPIKRFIKKLILMDSFVSVLDDPFFAGVRDSILNWEGTLASLKSYIENFLESKTKDTVRVHSRTVMENECIARQQEVARILEAEGKPFDFDGFKHFLMQYDPEALDAVQDEYALNISTIESFDELANFFYQPERMHAIRQSLGVKVRARSRNGERKGNKWAVKSFNLDGKIRKLGEFVADFNETAENSKLKAMAERIKERETEAEEAKRVRRLAKQRYDTAKHRGAPEEDIKAKRKEYDEMVAAAVSISKSLSAARTAYRKALRGVQRKKGAIEKIREYREKYSTVIENAKAATASSDAGGLDELEAMFKIAEAESDNIPYCTWSFKADGMDEKVIRVVEEELTRGFSSIKARNGEPEYINVTSYAYLDNGRNAVMEFFVDYPKNSKLYSAFANNRNLSSVLLNGIERVVEDRLGHPVDFDYKSAKSNIDMKKSLESGPSMEDAWDIPSVR